MGADPRPQQVHPSNVKKAKQIHSKIQRYILQDLPAIRWYNGMGPVQHDVLDELPDCHRQGLQNTPSVWNGYINMTGIDASPSSRRRAGSSSHRSFESRSRECAVGCTPRLPTGPPHPAAGTRDPLSRPKEPAHLLTFWFAVTIDWLIPRLMPGDPIDGLVGRIQADSTASQELHEYFTESFELDQPL